MKLMNPGPVTLSDRVRKALLQDDLCHRETEFQVMTLDVLQKLGRIYPDAVPDYKAVMLTGSGTSAVEAMLGSLIPKNSHTLVIANGVYGERGYQMLQAQGKSAELLKLDWVKPLDLQHLTSVISSNTKITDVFVIHHETTTGRLNPIAPIAAACQARGVRLYLDAVSSFGAEWIDFKSWNLEAVAATANKCLHGVPGISFVVAKKSAFTERSTAATSVYLDLYRYEQAQRQGWSPFTQSVQALYALQAACDEFFEHGGWEARNQAYKKLATQVRSGLQSLGIPLLLESADVSSQVLVGYKMKSPVTYQYLHDELKKNGFTIYAGQGQFDGEIFRISTMGAITPQDIDRFLGIVTQLYRA